MTNLSFMNNRKSSGINMRIIHRYLGFFLAGIMAVYALSGVVLIFRDTDFLKQEKHEEKVVDAGITPGKLGKALGIKGLKVTKKEGSMFYFAQGTYNQETGQAVYTTKNLPLVLDSMTKLHKANTGHPLFWLNIFFGLSLLFFVVSAFWMFRPATPAFKKGLYFALAGMVLTLVLLFV